MASVSGSTREGGPATPLELNLGDVLRLKRAHPCGGTDWQVTRLGADIGLRCLTCNRRVLLERPTLEKRLKQFVSRGSAETALPSSPLDGKGVGGSGGSDV